MAGLLRTQVRSSVSRELFLLLCVGICGRQSNGKVLPDHYRHKRRRFAGDERVCHQPVTAMRLPTARPKSAGCESRPPARLSFPDIAISRVRSRRPNHRSKPRPERSAHLRVARDAATAIAHGGCGGRESARCASLSQGGNGCVGGANERAQLPSPRSSPRLRRGFNQQHMPARSVLASVINAMHANPFFEPDRVFN
jgi:hypothetical protein